mmetsp:Transcript_47018/g.134553  ORF Transcript_47018/g.134553 Transcript_47018/m.134553 type:complete len:638 (-) Transcript_47018:128-2041(-)
MSGEKRSKVLTISREGQTLKQFVLAVGEVLVIGRAPDSDLVAELRGVSARHAELTLVEQAPAPAPAAAAAAPGAPAAAPAAPEELQLDVRIRDVSTNGTGMSSTIGQTWSPLRKGEIRSVGACSHLLLPFNRKAKDPPVVLTVRVIGECLPDAHDDRRREGRWRYHAKLGEGALGIVYRASDVTGHLREEVAVKVSKIHRLAKQGARLRHAYILHREAQWSLQRLHHSKSSRFCPQRASLFARYLEDHTGRWAPDLDFEEERTVFEAADFVWERFRNAAATSKCPYVVMELVPGRTLHQCMGWGGGEAGLDPPLNPDEKVSMAKEMVKALDYLATFGLIHRDFRTTNIMLVGRSNGVPGRIQVIDLGHTIAAEQEQVKNRSAVVRCSWKETKVKHFDWAPAEVKGKEVVNFAFPIHAFDVYSLAVLFLQLELGILTQARLASIRLAGGDSGQSTDIALGIRADFLRRMLGSAVNRPRPLEVLQALEPPPKLRVVQQPLKPRAPEQKPKLPPAKNGSSTRDRGFERSRDRSRSRDHHDNGRSRQNGDRGNGVKVSGGGRARSRSQGRHRGRARKRKRSRSRGRGRRQHGRGRGSSSSSFDSSSDKGSLIVDDGYHVWSPNAVSFGSESPPSPSTDPPS